MTTAIAAPESAPSDTRLGMRDQPQSRAGLTTLLAFIIRRDRFRGPLWVFGVTGVVLAGSSSVVGLYSTPNDLDNYASVAQADAAVKAISGPGYGLDDPTQGAVVMNEVSMFTLVAVALMCLFTVVRHTRAEEETGRAELVRAAPVGRHAALTAAIIWVGAITVATATCVAIGMTIWLPVVGSVAFGAAIAGLGLVFVGVGAVGAQLASSARAANSLGGVVLGIAFALRAVGDMGNEWLTWLSPLGWAQGIRAFADERWWVMIPLLLTAGFAMTGSFALSARRDLGHGLLTQRLGPALGSPRLASPLALAFRLQRSSLIGWAIGVGLMGFFMGVVSDQADELAENEAIADLMAQAGQGTFTESFLSTIMLMSALMVSGFFVSSVLRLRSEERAIRADPVLATPVSRGRWLWSHLTVALVGGSSIMVATGLSTGIGYAVQVGDASEILPLVGAALALLPALFVLAGVTVLLVGAVPRWAPVAWGGVGFVALVGLLGQTLDLPQWIRNISPFEHVPRIPAVSVEWLPIVALCVVAAVLIGLATAAMRRRDLM